jgi:Fe2+ transport system protein B
MVAVIIALYQFTFTYSEMPVGWFERFFSWLGETVSNNLPEGMLQSLVVSGIIDGVGGVLGFVPLIMFMFLEYQFWRIPDTWHVLPTCWIVYSESLAFMEVQSCHLLYQRDLQFRLLLQE